MTRTPKRAAVDPAPTGPARKPYAEQCTRVYTHKGRVAHLLSPASTIMGGVTLCPAAPSWPDEWRGTGSQAEHELAASLPLCKACEKRATAEDEYYSEPSQWRDPENPAAEETPVTRRGARGTPAGSAGMAAPVPPPMAGAAPQTSRPVLPSPPVPDGTTSSPQRLEREVAGKPDPGTGAEGGRPSAPGQGRAPSPAGSAVDADAALSAGSSGALFLDLQDAERAALGHTRREDAKAYLNAHLAGKMTEAELEEEIRDACKKLGILRFHVRFSLGTTAGLPDDILIGSRGILWRECKTAKGKVTEAQQEAGQALTEAGQDWAVWRPADWFSGRIQAELAAIAGLRAGSA